MKKQVAVLSLLLVLLASGRSGAQTEVFSFEPGESQAGYSFTRLFGPMCATDSGHQPGYVNGRVDGSCVGYGPGDGYPTFIDNALTFSLVSGYFTSAFYENATLSVWGLRPGESLWVPTSPSQGSASFFAQVIINTQGPLHLTFNGWTGLSSVAFSSNGGAPIDQNHNLAGNYFAIDQLTVVTATPEPASAAMLAAGLLLVLGAAHRRTSRKATRGA